MVAIDVCTYSTLLDPAKTALKETDTPSRQLHVNITFDLRFGKAVLWTIQVISSLA